MSDVNATEPRGQTGEGLRLFAGLWPGDSALRALWQYQSARAWPRGARLVQPARLHLTLHFFARFPAERLDELIGALTTEFEAFELHLNRAEVWRRDTVVLVPDPVPPGLTALYLGLSQSLERAGLASPRGTFRPHLTLARNARRVRTPHSDDAAVREIRWTVNGFDLVQSMPGSGDYRVLHHFDAQPPGDQTR